MRFCPLTLARERAAAAPCARVNAPTTLGARPPTLARDRPRQRPSHAWPILARDRAAAAPLARVGAPTLGSHPPTLTPKRSWCDGMDSQSRTADSQGGALGAQWLLRGE
eukprot:361094-Chlamydomonas_euryale.AAC.1